ncbi:acetyl-coenzyme A synthetase N-terminal domain-containing protein [Niabella ginsengisoli]|uniref:Acetyl-coenzyme A synthetase N-terminal domain-containing protein n=1 Tax=Niabella ginsengisoli TaxID=522298 RepID=A0ABS9SFI7_9BACT|nr:acetyl-coenzyme A synthetase N-terminal domain-containing protein [Niabella ginsengisoli]MCH5597120.1 hypothetical protein [Niabella ginsengisoli]
MSYPFQIKSLEQYHADYKRSLEDPEGFWSEVADHFEWKKSNLLVKKDWNGTSKNLR